MAAGDAHGEDGADYVIEFAGAMDASGSIEISKDLFDFSLRKP
ncbi:hypothetical protein [Kineosporia succinea]|uniref:Uncharacterized protein n=1 Tax=Kineosporia succinea TaxID=84632 RepID=A0ABT9NXS4_9ACTN|nr:hypothetical protein [Kineosporia succinea]MDP9825217.1 hypothetical protein [Kineosporia succinea]